MEAHRKILIADDTAMFRELGALFLARFGEVTTASGGHEALAIALRERPDVIVADLLMPDMDGDVLCDCVRRDKEIQDTPFVLVIPGENPEDRARAVRAGADDVVAKPISRIALVDAVNRFLRSSQRSAGLARVDVEARVCIRNRDGEAWGHSLNLSRGGIFVTADQQFPVATEVELELLLPETEAPLHSTARVVWERQNGNEPAGMGLQFLALDRESTRQIESFVYERADDVTRPATPVPSRMS